MEIRKDKVARQFACLPDRLSRTNSELGGGILDTEVIRKLEGRKWKSLKGIVQWENLRGARHSGAGPVGLLIVALSVLMHANYHLQSKNYPSKPPKKSRKIKDIQLHG